MRTKVNTSFLNPGSTFQSGVPTLSVGASRAVRYWATPRPTAKPRPASSTHNKTPLLTAAFYQALGREPRWPWARLARSAPGADGVPRESGALPPGPAARGAWPLDPRPDAANAPVENGRLPDRGDRATTGSGRPGLPCPGRPGIRWPGPDYDRVAPPAG